ncbi:gamma-butyrobetaine dioxygenase-like [Brachionichthys hirsutus]|uniref:gamma-butyrobetaine dioxygenase-like n=1 Tax=Brachionichthys hirsutus TaxID=412623 RepID=UPI0036043F80
MWMNAFSRIALPALQRSTATMAFWTPRACRRSGEAAGPLRSCLQSMQIREQQTASLPLSQHSVRHVQSLHEERMIAVEWEDGSSSLYPFTWLRDNCQCPLCFLDSAQARKLLMADTDVNIGVDAVEVTKDNKVSILWPDQHSSVFHPDWLKKRCFSPAARQTMQEELFLKECYYWDSKLHIPTANYEEVIHDDKAALDWLLALRRFGLVHLKGAPKESGPVDRLSKRIGYHRLTYYGHTWEVSDKYMANNLAYTSEKLSVHTDYPALQHTPGVQFLHCIKPAAEGGETDMVDGFHAAMQLQREDPEAFKTLTTLRADFTDRGTDYCDFMLQSKKRIIELNSEGQIKMINFNNATRDSVLDVPLQQVQPFYRAYRAFMDILNRPENMVTFRMEPGEMVTFDNWRLLHGRRRYTNKPDAMRHLEGAYLDWDEVTSRLRILRCSVQQKA